MAYITLVGGISPHCYSERSAQHGVKNLTVYSKCSAMHSHCHSERSAQHGVKNLTVHQERSAMIETMRFFTSLRSFRMTKRTLRSFRTTNKVIHCHSERSAQHGVKNLVMHQERSTPNSHCHSERSAQHGVKNLTVYSKCSAMYSHCHSERSEESHRIAMKCTSRSLTAPAACSR